MNRRTRHLVVAALALALIPSATAAADVTGATVDKMGWWNRANTQTSTPAGPVTIPPPPGIPEGSLVVGAVGPVGDEPNAIAAVGIQPDVGPGATLERFTLRITEDPAAQGNQGTEEAVIVACPITDFWAGGENAPWDTRPTDDCTAASVPGQRGDDGTWTFDLAPIGELWFDTFGTIVADGVVLRPVLEETTPFQAVFDEGSIDIELVAEAAPEDDDPFEAPPFSDPGGTDSGLSNSGGGGGIFSDPVVTTPPSGSFEAPSSPDVAAPADDGGVDTAAPPAIAPDSQPVASGAGDIFGNLSPAVYLGILLFAGLLLTTSYWFGPNGQPVTTVRRRGVSRALDARATKGTPR